MIFPPRIDFSIFRFVFVAMLMCTISSCTFLQPLTVQTQYLSHEDLASFHIGTPDPTLDCPPVGERLLIQWYLPHCQFQEGLLLSLKVRFKNHQEEERQISIEKNNSYYLYELIDEDYFKTGGIQTYLVEIRQGDCIIASWKHPLWTNLITFPEYPK